MSVVVSLRNVLDERRARVERSLRRYHENWPEWACADDEPIVHTVDAKYGLSHVVLPVVLK